MEWPQLQFSPPTCQVGWTALCLFRPEVLAATCPTVSVVQGLLLPGVSVPWDGEGDPLCPGPAGIVSGYQSSSSLPTLNFLLPPCPVICYHHPATQAHILNVTFSWPLPRSQARSSCLWPFCTSQQTWRASWPVKCSPAQGEAGPSLAQFGMITSIPRATGDGPWQLCCLCARAQHNLCEGAAVACSAGGKEGPVSSSLVNVPRASPPRASTEIVIAHTLHNPTLGSTVGGWRGGCSTPFTPLHFERSEPDLQPCKILPAKALPAPGL